MSIGFFLGAGTVILLIVGAGVLSGRRVKTAQDFTLGGGAGTVLTVGAIMSTQLGGNMTVGTAQLSYVYGLSGMWYTLGAMVGCILLALFFSDKLRNSEEVTLGEVIGKEFGGRIQTLTSLCAAVGSILNLVTQLLSGAAIMATLLPNVPFLIRVCLVAVLVLLYVIFGGARSTGAVGIVKTLFLLPAIVICSILAYKAAGGWRVISTLPAQKYFNLIARGPGIDLGAALSATFGVVTSQPYVTAILGAKDKRTAKRALWIAAAVSPLLGIGGTLVGYCMRLSMFPVAVDNTAALTAASKSAFPDFVQLHFPPFLCGIILATLLIAAAGTSAGLLLGTGTIFQRDIVDRITDRFRDSKSSLRFSRVCLIVLLAVGAALALIPTSFIIDLGFLSLGLRAAAMLSPMLAALFFPGKTTRTIAYCSVFAGLIMIVAAQFAGWNVGPSLVGILSSLLVMATGTLARRLWPGNGLQTR